MQTSQRHVVLTGFMGTGKSTIGRMVAKSMRRAFVDTDGLIAGRHGSISAIFESQGEDAFRTLERDAAAELAARTVSMVIATGGRTLLDEETAVTFARSGRIFCLAASLDSVTERLLRGNLSKRPLLAGSDPRKRIEALYHERAPLYAAFEQVPTDRRSHRDVADEIVARFNSGEDER